MSPKPYATLNCRGRLLPLDRPRIMGILNVTPDSFYDGGRYRQADALLAQAERLLAEGADLLDVGGMSTRPGAAPVPLDEERRRVLPAVAAIAERFPEALVSVDTVRADVAREAVAAGAALVNDVSAGRMDAAMYATVAELRVPYVLMHMQGRPDTMQQQPQYADVRLEVFDFLAGEIARLRQLGIGDIVADPGFGFGKSLAHNYALLRHLPDFQHLGVPILVGLSRKSMIYKLLGNGPEDALNGSTVLHTLALQGGANILRVHDVRAAAEVRHLWEAFRAL